MSLLFWRPPAMPPNILPHSNKGKATTVETRLGAVLQYLLFRYLGLSVAAAAKLVGWPPITIYRHGQRFLAYGRPGLVPRGRAIRIPARKTGNIPRDQVANVLAYLAAQSRGLPCQAADGLPMPSSELHELGERLLQYGLAGLAPDWREHIQDQVELCQFDVGGEILESVERLAGELGDVAGAWRRFGRSRACPWRLSVYIRKRKDPPQSMVRAVRLEAIEARAWRGGSGQVYVHAGGKFGVLPKGGV